MKPKSMVSIVTPDLRCDNIQSFNSNHSILTIRSRQSPSCPQLNILKILGPSGFRVGPHRVRNPSTFPKTFTITAGAVIVPVHGAAERAQAKETVLPPRDRERRIVSAPQRGAVYQPGVKPRVGQFNNGGVLKERRIFLNDRPVANQP